MTSGSDRLRAMGAKVYVAHPGRARMIFRSKRKNDRIDAQKLAKLLFLGEVPTVHVPSSETRAWRELIEFRRRLVDRRVAVKNTLRALFRGQGIAMPRSLWSRKGLAWVEDAALSSSSAQVRREILLDELRSLEQKITRVTDELDRIGQKNPSVGSF